MSEVSFTSRRLPPEVVERLQRWVSLHRVLWVLTLVCFFMAWNRGLALLYGLFSLLVALLALSYVLPLLQLRSVTVERRQMGDFFVGREGTLVYRLSSAASRYHLELRDALPFAGENGVSAFIPKVAGQVEISRHFECSQRGCYRVVSTELSSAYPFGIFSYTRLVDTPEEEYIVFPKVVELRRLPMPVSGASAGSGATSVSRVGGCDEFAAVRDYRSGDPLNHIHWAASARGNGLVVKEYERLDQPALLIVLDCQPGFNVGEGARSSLEIAISLAASMARFATMNGVQCFLMAEDVHPVEIVLPPYTANLNVFYEQLARLKGQGGGSYSALVERAHRQYPQANLVTTFRLDESQQALSVPANLTHIDMEMVRQSFLYPAQFQQSSECRRSGNRLTYRVAATTELELLFT